MTMKIATAIAVAAGVLIMPNIAQANGAASSLESMNGISQVYQIKANQTRKQGRAHRKHRGKNRHFGGHYHFTDHGYNPRRICGRLKRKAYYTGSRYWWKRYRRCMNRYYY